MLCAAWRGSRFRTKVDNLNPNGRRLSAPGCTSGWAGRFYAGRSTKREIHHQRQVIGFQRVCFAHAQRLERGR